MSRTRLRMLNCERTLQLTLMMTSAKVVETFVSVSINNPSQGFSHLDDETTLSNILLDV